MKKSNAIIIFFLSIFYAFTIIFYCLVISNFQHMSLTASTSHSYSVAPCRNSNSYTAYAIIIKFYHHPLTLFAESPALLRSNILFAFALSNVLILLWCWSCSGCVCGICCYCIIVKIYNTPSIAWILYNILFLLP